MANFTQILSKEIDITQKKGGTEWEQDSHLPLMLYN